MYFRMQRLYSPIHHFREAGDLIDWDDGDPLPPQGLGRAAGGDDLPLEVHQLTRKVYDAALVGNREQRPHQSSATARTKSARLSKSFRSTTSAGECEYRSGQPMATSTTPNCVKVEPSLPPLVMPICRATPRARASATSESTYAGGVMDELSSARATAPAPIGATAKFGSSSGESAETNVSMACTRRVDVPSWRAAASAPSRPISSRVLKMKITGCLSLDRSSRR